MATIIQVQHRGNHDRAQRYRNQRWARCERADVFERYGVLHTQGVSQLQAAKVLDVPRSTLQAWRAYQDRLDACPEVVAFFHSVSGLAFLHRLVIALHVVCVEIGALRHSPGVSSVGADGSQSLCGGVVWHPAAGQLPRGGGDGGVPSRRARLAHAMLPKDITLT